MGVLDGSTPLTRSSNSGGMMGGKTALEMRYGAKGWNYSMGKTHQSTDKFFDHYFAGLRENIGHFTKQFDKYLKLWEMDYKARKKKDGGGLLGSLYHFAPHFFDFKVWKKLTGQARKPEIAALHQIRDILYEMLPKGKKNAKMVADPMELWNVLFEKGGDLIKKFRGKSGDKADERKGIGKVFGSIRDAVVATKNFTFQAWKEDKADRKAVYAILDKDLKLTEDAKKDAAFDRIKNQGKDKKKGGILGFLGMIFGAVSGLLGGLLGGFKSIFGGLLGGLSKVFMSGIEKVLLKFGLEKAAGAAGDMMTPDGPNKGKGKGKGPARNSKGQFMKKAPKGKLGLLGKIFGGGAGKAAGGTAARGAGMGALRGIGAVAGAAAVPLAFLPDIISSIGSFKEGKKGEGAKTVMAGKGPANSKMGKIGNVALQSLKYAAVGAAIGSVVPGLGTGIGAAIGATFGAGVGVVRQGLVKPILNGAKSILLPKKGKTTGQKVSGAFKQAVVGAALGFAVAGPAGVLPGLVAGAAVGSGRQGLFKKAGAGVQSFIHGGAKKVGGKIVGGLKAAGGAVSGLMAKGDTAIQGMVDKAKALNVQMSSWVEGKVKGAISWLFAPNPALAAKMLSIKNFIMDLPKTIKDGVTGLWDKIKNSAVDAFNWLKDPKNWEGLWEMIKDAVLNAGKSVGKSVSGAYTSAKTGVANAGASIASGASGLWAKAKGAVTRSAPGKMVQNSYVGDMLEGDAKDQEKLKLLEQTLNDLRLGRGGTLVEGFGKATAQARAAGQGLNMEALVNKSATGRTKEDLMAGLNSLGADIGKDSMDKFQASGLSAAEFAKRNMESDLQKNLKAGLAPDAKMVAFYEQLGGNMAQLVEIQKKASEFDKKNGKEVVGQLQTLNKPKPSPTDNWMAMSFGGQTRDVWGTSGKASQEDEART